jgi:predicted N-acyltransferase
MTEPRRNPTLQQVSSIREVDARAWNALAGGDPFLRHEFLVALENSGCIGPGTAWQPCHLVLSQGPTAPPLGALPLYWKYDSRGEFVFDWTWADAYQRAGLRYYPKLVSSVPFTPATGNRLLIGDPLQADAIAERLIGGALGIAADAAASSLHVLFPSAPDRPHWTKHGFLERKGCQFHWHNDGYATFEDFLARFSSEKRKKARRERRRIVEADIRFEHLRGDEPSREDWDAIYQFYSRTFLRRGREPYLNRAFLDEIATTMPENLAIMLARFKGQPIATAICFRGADTLYGRYWGSLADFHSLHFEACYYQGIEYCIAQGLQRFEPGTQGEHKISRGFSPRPVWSYHWLGNRTFRDAIERFLTQETAHVDTYMDDLQEHVPYRRDLESTPTR